MAAVTPKVLVIAGMHRSGTSLIAEWLAECGLFIGKELLETRFKHANPEGFHEDMDFLRLHKSILLKNGYVKEGYLTPGQPLVIGSEFQAQAGKLIEARQEYPHWGWKEPRTTLMLEFWKSLIPDMKMIAVYRNYWQVVDSMLRRKLNHPKRTRRWYYNLYYFPRGRFIKHYLLTWARYNADILAFANKYPDDSMIVHLDDLVPRSLDIVQSVNQRWDFALKLVDIQESVYVPGLLKKGKLAKKKETVQKLPPAAAVCEQTYQQLEQWRQKALDKFVKDTSR